MEGQDRTNDKSDNPNSRAARIARIGTTTTGIAGVILAINAALSNDFAVAGVLVTASALAFGLLAWKR